MDNQQNIEDLNFQFNQQKFLEHAAFAEHFARLKIANADNEGDYYMFAELEYYHRSRALHYKGMFNAVTTIVNKTKKL